MGDHRDKVASRSARMPSRRPRAIDKRSASKRGRNATIGRGGKKRSVHNKIKSGKNRRNRK